MTWPPAPAAQMGTAGNMAGFGTRRMHEEQQREAERRQQEWEQAEAERRYRETLQQQELDRQNLELERQRLAWEWSELQRQQREHEERRLQFQQEQAYAAEQQRILYEQEQQRLLQQSQEQFLQQQHQLEQQQIQLQQHQQQLQEQQQQQQADIAEQQRKLKKAEVELQRKLRSQAADAQKLQTEREQQQQLAARLQAQQQELLQRKVVAEEAEAGDETLQPAPDSPDRDAPPRREMIRANKPLAATARPRQRTESTVKMTEQRTKAWAAERAEAMLVWCGDCRQDVLMTQLDTHHCMRRNHSGTGSQDSARTADLTRPVGLSADAGTPSPGLRSRSPFFERHLELERERSRNSPLSPSLSPIWPDQGRGGRANSNDGGPLIRRTPSEDERERLISTPSPIPPDLSPEEEAAIRAERKRRIEAQREAKKNGSAAAAATAIIAALKFDSIARTAGNVRPPRSGGSPTPASSTAQRVMLTEAQTQRVGLPLDKFPSSSSLASTQSSLLSANQRPYQRDRAYSGSSAVMTPSTSYEFSNGAISSPDLLSTSAGSRHRANSNASHKVETRGGAAGGSGLRLRLDSAGSSPAVRNRQESDPAARVQLQVDTKQPISKSSRTTRSPAGLEPFSAVENSKMRLRSNSVSPMPTRSMLDGSAGSGGGGGGGAAMVRKNTGGTDAVDLRGIEDLMRGLETDELEAGAESRHRRAERQRTESSSGGGGGGGNSSNSSKSTRKTSTSAASGSAGSGASPQVRARTGGTTPRPPLPTLKTSDRLLS